MGRGPELQPTESGGGGLCRGGPDFTSALGGAGWRDGSLRDSTSSVALTGTARSPLAELVASGVGRYRPESGEPVSLERFNARLGVRGDALVLHRFEANLLNGSVVATGLGNWRRGEFLAQIQAGGLEVNRLVPDAAGQTCFGRPASREGWLGGLVGLGRVYGLTANEVRLRSWTVVSWRTRSVLRSRI